MMTRCFTLVGFFLLFLATCTGSNLRVREESTSHRDLSREQERIRAAIAKHLGADNVDDIERELKVLTEDEEAMEELKLAVEQELGRQLTDIDCEYVAVFDIPCVGGGPQTTTPPTTQAPTTRAPTTRAPTQGTQTRGTADNIPNLVAWPSVSPIDPNSNALSCDNQVDDDPEYQLTLAGQKVGRCPDFHPCTCALAPTSFANWCPQLCRPYCSELACPTEQLCGADVGTFLLYKNMTKLYLGPRGSVPDNFPTWYDNWGWPAC